MLTFLIALAIVAGIGAGVYFLVIKKKATTTAPPAVSGWQFQYSNNVNGTPEDFDFPILADGVHYCVKSAPPLAIGQIVTLHFTLSGTGTLVPTQGSTANVSLYIQRVGDNLSAAGEYQQYRYYHVGVPLGAERDYIISAALDPSQWTDVLGSLGAEHQSEFLACLANAQYIGFVFGDPSAGATGHGVYANGPVHFHLNEFSVT